MRKPTLLDFDLDIEKRRAFILSGRMDGYSTARQHVHPFHQIMFVKNGISVLEDDNRKMPLWGEMGALIPAGRPHRSQVIGDEVTYQCLYFHRDFLDAGERITLFRMSELGGALLTRLCRRRNRSDISLGEDGECLRLFLKVFRAKGGRRLRQLLLPLARSKTSQIVIQYVEANFTRRLTLNEIAAAAGYSRRHIERLFAQEMAISIFEYLSLYRALQASLALARGRDKITTIAMDCGYDAPSSFYRDFRTYFGSTPRAFRARLLQPAH